MTYKSSRNHKINYLFYDNFTTLQHYFFNSFFENDFRSIFLLSPYLSTHVTLPSTDRSSLDFGPIQNRSNFTIN